MAIRLRRLNKAVPAYSNCKNCDTKLSGVFCHKCGQSSLDTTQSFLRFTKFYFESTFQTDGKVFSTLRLLFFKPGKLSLEFVNGHIIKYVHPMKLFLFCSVFLFAVMWFVYETSIEKEKPLFSSTGSITSISQPNAKDASVIINRITDSITAKGQFVISDTNDANFTELRELAQDIDSPREEELRSTIKKTLKRDLPFVFMFLMPLYALILKRFFRKSYKNYLPHFVFAIHINTLLLILMTLVVCSATIDNIIVILSFVALIIFVGYIVAATRVFYEQSWPRTILKSLTVLFLITISGAILGLLGIAFSLVYNIHTLQ